MTERCDYVLVRGPNRGKPCVRSAGHAGQCTAIVQTPRSTGEGYLSDSEGEGVDAEQVGHGRVTQHGAELFGHADRWASQLGATPAELREQRGRR